MNVQDLAFNDSLLSQASLTPIFIANYLALALAVWTHGLESLYHWAHLSHHSLHTSAVAASTGLHSAFFTTPAIAGRADD